jgi:hypothetical protein
VYTLHRPARRLKSCAQRIDVVSPVGLLDTVQGLFPTSALDFADRACSPSKAAL